MKAEEYTKLLQKNVQKVYKKVYEKAVDKVNKQAAGITSKLDLAERIDKMTCSSLSKTTKHVSLIL